MHYCGAVHVEISVLAKTLKLSTVVDIKKIRVLSFWLGQLWPDGTLHTQTLSVYPALVSNALTCIYTSWKCTSWPNVVLKPYNSNPHTHAHTRTLLHIPPPTSSGISFIVLSSSSDRSSSTPPMPRTLSRADIHWSNSDLDSTDRCSDFLPTFRTKPCICVCVCECMPGIKQCTRTSYAL